ncbi:MAG TPA: flippase [Candidatus Kapabacteria bacterium]|nr:flippase [Candidatus Kapabacteria bacterium]
MANTKVVIKNIFSLTVAEAVSRILTFIYTLYLARILSPSGFGMIGFSKYVIAIFLIIAALGLDSIGTREIAKDKSNIKPIVNNIFTIRLFSSLLVYFLLLFFIALMDFPINEKIAIMIMGVNIFSNSLLLNWTFQGLQRMEVFAMRSIIVNVLNFCGIFLLIKNPGDTLIAIVIIVASSLINMLWLLFYYSHQYGKISLEFDLELWKKLLKSSTPILLSLAFVAIYDNIGMILLRLEKSNYEVGIFTAGYNILQVAMLASTILQNVFFPIFPEKKTKPDRLKIVKNFSRLNFAVGTYVSLFIFVFAEYIAMLFGEKYISSISVIRILMISNLIVFYTLTLYSPLIAWDKERQVFFSNLAGLIVGITANIILVPIFSENGVAISSVLCEFAVLIVVSILFYKEFHTILLLDFLKYFIIAAIATIPFFFLQSNIYQAIVSMFLSIGLFILLNFIFKTITVSEIKMLLKK